MDYEIEEAQEWKDGLLTDVQSSSQVVRDAFARSPSATRYNAKPRVAPAINLLPTKLNMRSGPRNTRRNRKDPTQQLVVGQSKVVDAQQQKFCRSPPDYSIIQAIGNYRWPDQALPPDHYFGSGLEAFDPVRIDHSCWITCDSGRNLQVLGASAQNVKAALCRLRASFNQFRARKSECKILRLIRPIRESAEENLELIPYEVPRTSLLPRVVLKFSPSSFTNTALPDDDTKTIERENTAKLGSRLRTALNRARLLNGRLTFDCQYGKFIITNYKSNIKSVTSLKDMLNESQCRTEVSSSLDDPTVEAHLLHKFTQANQIEHFKGSKAPEPIYGALFVLRSNDPLLGLDTMLSLSVEYEMNGLGHFDRLASHWVAAPKSAEQHRLLDVTLVDIPKSMAWNISITRTPGVEPTDHPALVNFEAGISFDQIDVTGIRSSGHICKSFLHFDSPANLEVVSVQERIIYKFKLIDSTFNCEVRYSQDQGKCSSCTNPRWSVNVISNEWAALLSRNIDLGIGERVEAGPNDICPIGLNHETIEDFVRSMKVVEDIVHSF